MHAAIAQSDIREVKRILKGPVNINQRDKQLQTPLHIAAASDNLEMLLLLIDKGADVNAVDKNSWSPLHVACNSGSMKAAFVLLEQPRINPSIGSINASTPFHYIVRCKPSPDTQEFYLRLLQKFVEKKIDINARSSTGEVPLHQAVMKLNTTAVRFLCESKCNINCQNK